MSFGSITGLRIYTICSSKSFAIIPCSSLDPKKIQDEYWNILKASPWNQGRTARPQYAELETVLVDNPDFENIDALTADIINRAVEEADRIIVYLKKLDC